MESSGEGEKLLVGLRRSILGIVFPHELCRLVADFGIRTIVYQVLMKPDPLASCQYFSTRLFLPDSKRCWWLITSNGTAGFRSDDDNDDNDDDDDDNEYDGEGEGALEGALSKSKSLSLIGYLDDDRGQKVIFSINGNPKPNFAISRYDSTTFSSLEIELGDSSEHFSSAIIQPFAPLTELFIQHICNG